MPFPEDLKAVISFLTVIPVKVRAEPFQVALNMYLFPIVGAGVGLVAGLLGILFLNIFPSSFVPAVLTVGILYLTTGLHHFDGLLDFGDGLMFRGLPEAKIAVMRDKATGAGGLGLGLVTTLLLVSCLSATTQHDLMPSIVISETSAKLAMVVGALIGRPSLDGIGAIFIRTLKVRRRKITVALASLFSIAVAAIFLGIRGLFGLAAAVLVSGIIVVLSHRNFNCVTGDVLGAINELARSSSLLVLVMFHWV